MPVDIDSDHVLRTLSPALRDLGRTLRAWLDGKRRFPLGTLMYATLEGLVTDLNRQADSLRMDKPHLVVMLMGGTGVGKSTLLNALAAGTIAPASFARPTTRDPVVYYHESISPQRLDPALQHCKLVPNDRPGLEQKILVDTPDIDSNDLANRDKLMELLPVADIVLYVGSQEKYHDRLGWDVFLKHRQRRAFAFVLNKWDRCVHSGASGVRPDEDLLRDLQAEGFQSPLLFRTCAQYWVDQISKNGTPGHADLTAMPPPAEGEQFLDLLHWLELGLTRLEIEAIKARGVSQLLRELERAMAAACPPELSDVAEKTAVSWRKVLQEEARFSAGVLLTTLEPYQKEIEHHFALQRQRRFRGIMGTYLHWFNRLKYAGSTLRDRIPFLTKFSSSMTAPKEWDLASFTRSCSNAASERHLDSRGRALANRLLVEADKEGFPVQLLTDPTENAAKLDWRMRYSHALVETLDQVEREWSAPSGIRRWMQAVIVFLADWLPMLAFAGMCTILLWRYFLDDKSEFAWNHLFLPFMATLLAMILLHIAIGMFLPLRWPAIRAEFQRHLEARLLDELESAYRDLPAEVARGLLEERRTVEKYVADTHEVGGWLEQREQAASIAGLYGKS